ncbi:MAG: L-histidine N(alpha)-methyltransferase [Planctomycetaceae bacterium]
MNAKLFPPVIADETVSRVDLGQVGVPDEWGSRRLYLGANGASNWLNVVNDPQYPLRGAALQQLLALREAAIAGFTPRTLVSLGPGDGTQDAVLARSLNSDEDALNYIPVDISRHLLTLAVRQVAPYAKIPAVLHGDFENAEVLLARVLREFSKPPVLITMLGGTIGNLDQGVTRFLSMIRRLLGDRDAFLVDVPLAGSAWTPEREPRLNVANYSSAFRSFFLRSPTVEQPLEQAGSDGVPFEEQFELSLGTDDELGARTIRATNRRTGGVVLNRRYDWDLFSKWANQNGFVTRFAESTLRSREDAFGMGVALLAPQ